MNCCRCGSDRVRRDTFGNFHCQQKLSPCGFWWQRNDGHRFWQETVTTPKGQEHYYHSPAHIVNLAKLLAILKPKGIGQFHPVVSGR